MKNTKQQRKAKATKKALARTADALPARVVATAKATESSKGSFWAQLAQVAAKPTSLEQVIARIASAPAGARAKMKPEARLASVGIRVRFAARNGYLQEARS